jgi:hypothetical protein
MTEKAKRFQERERAKVCLALNFWCHEGESISIRDQILRESWVTVMLESILGIYEAS